LTFAIAFGRALLPLPIANAIVAHVNLTQYLSSGASKAAALAREIGVAPALIYQWRTGRRPVPPGRCADIERATAGKVTRRDLRPDDWRRIWPELAEESAAPQHEAANAVAGEVA
jgi:DNA-binding transcriptional regulator YdaS (Cro superfamily)